MRRPQPLPTPPRREPEPDVSIETPVRAKPRGREVREEAIDVTPAAAADAIATEVDVPTLEGWATGADPEAETAVITDDGVFVRDEAPLAPVTVIGEGNDPDEAASEPAPRPRRRGRRAEAAVDDGAAAEGSESDTQPLTGWGDVWRASRAHRKALRKEVRRFTVRSRRRRLAWIISLSAVVAVVAGSFAVANSPLFAVEKITVVGTTSLDAATVQQALDGAMGAPLAAVDRDAVRESLGEFPAIETYSLEARPPHELVVRIVERTPVGVITAPDGYALVDGAGVTLATSATPPAGQPLISAEGGVEGKAFRAIGTVIRSLPASIRAQVSAASATTAYDVTLTLAATATTIVWGGAEDSAKKALVLEDIMVARPPAQVSVYDVSSASNVIVR